MSSITYGEMCDAVKSVIDDLVGSTLVVVQSYDELQEAYNDCPMAQIYVDDSETDAFTDNDRTSFRAGSRVSDTTVVIDIPCRARSHVDEDMKAVLDIADAVNSKLETQKTKPYFGNPNIKGFRWNWKRVTFQNGIGDSVIFFPGVKFSIVLKVF